MADLTVRSDSDTGIFDLMPPDVSTISDNGLVTGDDLETAVLASLFTWGRADPDEIPPDGSDDRKGWWGDAWPSVEGHKSGSKLWLLARRVLTVETLELARRYGVEALQWFIDDGIASTVEVVVTRHGPNRANMLITINRPNGQAKQIRVADLWGDIGGVL